MKTVIRVDNLSKRYLIGHQRESGDYQSFRDVLSQGLAHLGGRLVHPFRGLSGQPLSRANEVEEFWALKDVSFEVKQGDRIGIIGRNGAGKSTLLKILSRITEPTSGRIGIKGRVASLLEVGTGFHPELTGRENIFLNGAILGMGKQEIQRKFDEIVAFAEVEKFLDTPVKRYSSGMYVRLAFAVAAHLESEILFVDEVLAVGDAAFQKKCLGKMEDVGEMGRTIFYVSHNMGSVKKLCNRVMNLQSGQMMFLGNVDEGVNNYILSCQEETQIALFDRVDRNGLGNVKFRDCCCIDSCGNKLNVVITGERFYLKILYFSRRKYLSNVWFRVLFKNRNGEILFVCNNLHSQGSFETLNGSGEVVLEIDKSPFIEGIYSYDLQLVVNNDIEDDIENAGLINVETGDYFGNGNQPSIKDSLVLEHKWNLF